MSISSLSKRNVNVNVTADALGKVGKNEIGFLRFAVEGVDGNRGWLLRMKTFFGAGCSYLRCYLSREINFGRDFGKVGIVGLGWVGLLLI